MVIILWKSDIITTLYVCDVINYLCTITELTVDFWFHTGDERTVHLFILLRRIMSLFILILFTSSLTATTITTSSQGFHLEMNVSIVCNELLLQVTCVVVFWWGLLKYSAYVCKHVFVTQALLLWLTHLFCGLNERRSDVTRESERAALLGTVCRFYLSNYTVRRASPLKGLLWFPPAGHCSVVSENYKCLNVIFI